MIWIPGWFITWLTFPGVIIHEIGHRFFCDLAGVPVYDVRYFRFGRTSGYVTHGRALTLKQSLFISFGPLIVNTAVCMILTFAPAFPVFMLHTREHIGVLFPLAWVGYSAGIHAFPSDEDIESYRLQLQASHGRGFGVLAVRFMSRVIHVGNSFTLLKFAYAVCVSLFLPLIAGTLAVAVTL